MILKSAKLLDLTFYLHLFYKITITELTINHNQLYPEDIPIKYDFSELIPYGQTLVILHSSKENLLIPKANQLNAFIIYDLTGNPKRLNLTFYHYIIYTK